VVERFAAEIIGRQIVELYRNALNATRHPGVA
jgi:hypothetical protein